MEHQRKRRRKAAGAVWGKYWAVVEMKEEARRAVSKAYPVYVALTHYAWDNMSGVCNLLEDLDRRRHTVIQRVQSFTLPELRSSPQTAVTSLRCEYGDVATVLGVVKDNVCVLVEGIPMRSSYPAISESEEELVAHYELSEIFASSSDALDRFSELHRGFCGADELCKRGEGVSDVLVRELDLGRQLVFSGWKLKAALLIKMKQLDAYAERCVQATAQLDNILDIVSDTLMSPLMSAHQCYVCMDTHMFGITYCTRCSGTVCSGCTPQLVAHACDSGGVAEFNGEATPYS